MRLSARPRAAKTRGRSERLRPHPRTADETARRAEPPDRLLAFRQAEKSSSVAAGAGRRRADPRLARQRVDRDRADDRGGRRLLVDRAERDRARAGALRTGGRRARHDRRRARLRPPARGVPLRAARPAAPARVGAHDRPPLPLRDGRRAAARGAEGLGRRGELAGVAAKIDREEAYHRMHAELWIGGCARARTAPRGCARRSRLWPYALGVPDAGQRPEYARRVEVAVGFASRRRAGRARHPPRARAGRAAGGDDDGAPLRAGRAMVTEAEVWAALAGVPTRRSRSSRSSSSA